MAEAAAAQAALLAEAAHDGLLLADATREALLAKAPASHKPWE